MENKYAVWVKAIIEMPPGDKQDYHWRMADTKKPMRESREYERSEIEWLYESASPLPEQMLEVLKEIDFYLSRVHYEKGKPVYSNNIGAGSILHKKVKEAIANWSKTNFESIKEGK